MYAVVVFALALLSPLPFVSPFDSIVQDATAQSSANVPYDVPSFEIMPNLAVSPFGVIQNGVNGFDSIERPSSIGTFQIGDSIYAGVSGNFSFTIVNITDPSSPSQVTVLDTTVDSMFALSGREYVVIDGFTYLISGSDDDESVLIINVSNPSLPSLVAHITNGADYTGLDNPAGTTTVTINSSTYALVTAFDGDGVQIIDITDPSNPSPVSTITDGVGGYKELDGAYDITTVTTDSSTFALVTSIWDNGVQIIDITDPYNPAPASAITDGVGGYTELFHPHAVTTVTIDSSTFAVVTAISGDGVQIIDITDPYNPSPASALTDGRDGFTELDGPYGITITTIGTSTYAIVASVWGDGVQIIDITDPYNPTPAYAITEGVGGYTELYHAIHVTTVTTDSSTYALVAGKYDDGVQIIKLEQEYISAYTNNQNPKYAKAGDTLDISFTASDTIASQTSQILGLNASATVNGAVYDAMATVPSTPRESYATFTIQVANANNESVTVTENDISSNVFIDTISPSIELVGSADYTIPYGTLDPSIPDVTVSDGDPNYLGGFTLVKNATVDTTIPGSVYHYTYTANPDRSGNAGNSVTRTISVVPSTQNTSLTTSSFEITQNLIVSPFGVIQNGVNGFDSIERPSSIGTFQIGDSIYAGVSGNFSFTIVNITDPSSPSQVTVLDTTVDSMFALSGREYVVIDGFTYLISGSDDDESVLIINVSNPSLPSLVAHITNGADYTGLDNPAGTTTVTLNSSTYALVTAFDGDGVQIIDITDPSNPSPVSTITDGVGGYKELDGAYDITTVTTDSSTFALVTSIWDNGVQIIDITDPYNPAPASAITDGVEVIQNYSIHTPLPP